LLGTVVKQAVSRMSEKMFIFIQISRNIYISETNIVSLVMINNLVVTRVPII